MIRGSQRVQQGAGFGKDVFGFGGGEGPAENALRGELGPAFDVAADEAHEGAGIDGVFVWVGFAGEGFGKFEVEHFYKGFQRLLFVAVGVGEFYLGAFAV